MADIFISYSKAERQHTEALATELELHGYTVWWDTNLVSGDHFQKTIVEQLEAALAVIVIWTPSSTQSDWVYSEANRAARSNKLIPVRLPEVDIYDIPPPFDIRQTDLLANRKAIYAALARLRVRPGGAAPEPARRTTSPAQSPPVAPSTSVSEPDATLVQRPPAPPAPAAVGGVPLEQSASAFPPDARDYVTRAGAVVNPIGAAAEPSPSPAGPSPGRAHGAQRSKHWQQTRRLMMSVVSTWVVIAIVIHFFVDPLNGVRFLGFPLGYYMAAQGSLLGFLALLGWFIHRQNQIDRAVKLEMLA